MKAFLTLFLITISTLRVLAGDSTGTWIGTMEHKGTGENKTVWFVKMELTTEGDKCYGTLIYDFMQRNSPLTLEVKFKGYILENTLIINYYSKDIKKTGPAARGILLQFRYNLTLVKNKFNQHIYGDYVGMSKGLIADQTKGYLYLEPYVGDKEALVKKIDVRVDSLIAVKDNPGIPGTPPVAAAPTDVAINALPPAEKEKEITKKTEQPTATVKNTEARKLPVIEPVVELKKDTATIAAKPITPVKKDINPGVVTAKEFKIDTTNVSDKAKMEAQKKLTARENVLSEKLMVDTGEVVVEFYDNGFIDGDIITVIHNKSIALAGATLTDKALRFSFHVDNLSPNHEIVMYAENQGTVPPNTALMVITFGNQRRQVFLSADDKKSAVVLLELKK